MSPRSWTITLNRIPVSQNDEVWRERWKQYSYKRDWKEEVYWACKEAKIPELSAVFLSVTIYFPDRRNRDFDNYSPTTAKPIQDGLVFAGVIPTDDQRYVPQLPTVAFRHDKKNPRTEVKITEVTDVGQTQT